jgi:hypothetical protein
VRTLWDKDWISIVSGKQALYNAIAQFHQSRVCNASKVPMPSSLWNHYGTKVECCTESAGVNGNFIVSILRFGENCAPLKIIKAYVEG